MSKADKRRQDAPEGWHSVTPRIVARGTKELIVFVRRVFQATGEYRSDIPTVIKIGDSPIMISEAGVRPPMGAFLYFYVPDTDAVHRRAVAAGARVLEEPSVQPYGDRRSMVEDKWGNVWQIATRFEKKRSPARRRANSGRR
ncbi:MAG TPA: VOC family protein [Thermoanaerobaculia bacterium]|nr:VOC family protein [Thermoanaerobaculia bacterium]